MGFSCARWSCAVSRFGLDDLILRYSSCIPQQRANMHCGCCLRRRGGGNLSKTYRRREINGDRRLLDTNDDELVSVVHAITIKAYLLVSDRLSSQLQNRQRHQHTIRGRPWRVWCALQVSTACWMTSQDIRWSIARRSICDGCQTRTRRLARHAEKIWSAAPRLIDQIIDVLQREDSVWIWRRVISYLAVRVSVQLDAQGALLNASMVALIT